MMGQKRNRGVKTLNLTFTLTEYELLKKYKKGGESWEEYFIQLVSEWGGVSGTDLM